MKCRQKRRGCLKILRGIERARQIPKNKKVVFTRRRSSEQNWHSTCNKNTGRLRNTAEKRKKEKEEKEKIPE